MFSATLVRRGRWAGGAPHPGTAVPVRPPHEPRPPCGNRAADVIRILHENAAALGDLPIKTVGELGLDVGAAFTVPASTPALTAFASMATDEKSSLGLTDADGKLVGNLSGEWGGGVLVPWGTRCRPLRAAVAHAIAHSA